MVSLQDILSNKQSRGAFGEIQLQDIVIAALPPSAFEFQSTLSNGKRADCLLKFTKSAGSIVVDSSFPWRAFKLSASSKTRPRGCRPAGLLPPTLAHT